MQYFSSYKLSNIQTLSGNFILYYVREKHSALKSIRVVWKVCPVVWGFNGSHGKTKSCGKLHTSKVKGWTVGISRILGIETDSTVPGLVKSIALMPLTSVSSLTMYLKWEHI